MEIPSIPSAPAASGNDKIWSMLCHISTFLGVGFVLPLIVYLAMKEDSHYVRSNAREALNFHISLLIYGICCIPLIFVVIGIPLLVLLGIGSLVLSIVGAIRASNGETYHYPLTLRLVK